MRVKLIVKPQTVRIALVLHHSTPENIFRLNLHYLGVLRRSISRNRGDWGLGAQSTLFLNSHVVRRKCGWKTTFLTSSFSASGVISIVCVSSLCGERGFGGGGQGGLPAAGQRSAF
eukprot:1020070-Amorphochlora_amoeboformis.AAC.1